MERDETIRTQREATREKPHCPNGRRCKRRNQPEIFYTESDEKGTPNTGPVQNPHVPKKKGEPALKWKGGERSKRETEKGGKKKHWTREKQAKHRYQRERTTAKTCL